MPDSAYGSFFDETTDEQTTGQPTGAFGVISDGAIIDTDDEPDGEGLRRSVVRELSERADDEVTTDEDQATFRGYR